MRQMLGSSHPMVRYEENTKKLEQPVQIERFEINKKIKTPIKGYTFFEAKGIGMGYSGEVLDKKLYYGTRELDCFFFKKDADGFTAIFKIDENFGQILVIQQEKPSISRLKINLKAVHELVFNKLKAIVAIARGSPPTEDIGTWFNDRREELVQWSYENKIKIPRLSLFWCNIIPQMIPERLVVKNAKHDSLIWLGTQEGVNTLGKERIEEINKEMNEKIRWRLHYETN
jgi:hypothetical protein